MSLFFSSDPVWWQGGHLWSVYLISGLLLHISGKLSEISLWLLLVVKRTKFHVAPNGFVLGLP